MKQVPQLYRQTSTLFRPTRQQKIVVYLAVPPKQVVAWCVVADCEMTVRDARVWLTRAGSDYDFWLQPGDPALHLYRGERIWLSTDAAVDAEVSLSLANTGTVQWLMQLWVRLFF